MSHHPHRWVWVCHHITASHLRVVQDIKPENILIRLENSSVLDDVAKAEAEKPSPRKVLDDRIVYLSRNNFGHPKSSPGKPVITDFDTATPGNVSHPLTHPIQPNPYRSPEVTLGAPWTYSADIWNLGVMVRLIIVQPLVQD
jgi:serine/threonine protein kinase